MSWFVCIVLKTRLIFFFYSLPNIQHDVWLPSSFVYFVQTVPTKPAQLATLPNSVLKQSRLVPSPHVLGDHWKQEREGERDRVSEKLGERQTGPAAVFKNKTHDKTNHFRARGSNQARSSALKGPHCVDMLLKATMRHGLSFELNYYLPPLS